MSLFLVRFRVAFELILNYIVGWILKEFELQTQNGGAVVSDVATTDG